MKKYIILGLLLHFGIYMAAQTLADVEKNKVLLPNGWSLTPVGKSLPLGDLPLNMAVSNNKKWIAVTNNGQGKQSLQIINVITSKVEDNIAIAKSFVGLKFSANDQFLYASGGNDNWILKYAFVNGKLRIADTIKLGAPWPNRISPTGIDINDETGILYVTTKDDKCIYEIDIASKKIRYKIPLYTEAYTCLQSLNKKYVYISAWGGGKILKYNTALHKVVDSIAVGSNPNDICLTKNGQYLFVANANDNSVSLVDLRNNKIIETLNASLYADAPGGSTTNAVCLSEDEKTLYIANADNNCIAVFNVSNKGNSKSKGYIPVGWYPTSVKVIDKKLYVTNGKGYSSLANPYGPDPYNKRIKLGFQKGDSLQPMEVQYIGGLFKGTLSIVPEPSVKQLAVYSRSVYKNSPYTKLKETQSEGDVNNPIPTKIGSPSPIKYVFYIIKENRTYDQVLGDVKEGNGDSSLCLFGEKVTPNLHAISKEFVLLDNFYCDGEVSADGHNWSMGAYSNDYLEKTWVSSYGGKGGDYDAEGNRDIANNKNGFIWEQAKRAGISFRTYGEFADDYKPNIPVLKDHFCTYYTSWDQKVRDTTRVSQWKRDFDSLLAINTLPQLNTLRIINDHTEGLSKGRPTPFAHVADNDLAIGMFIDYLSKSKVWKESAVFIVEDDAQDGPDHVDAHRTTAFVAGGFVKRGFVDHTMYSTSSMLRTIELILGMPPMSQFDAGATPMWRSFSNEANLKPYNVKPAQIDLNEKNTRENVWQRKSELFDFSKEDRIQDREFTEVIWKAVKGADAIVPAPKRAAFIKMNK